jgi:aryl-alcohol dehydrogenase-like predicted oxidoreductase
MSGMRTRQFGNSGIAVSEIGFGAWGIGGTVDDARGYGPTDDAESIRALQAAHGRGITFYDTAALYGYGHSEELIGAALAPVRGDIFISTKVGYLNFRGEQDFSPRQIRLSLEQSLKRLKTDYVDLYQLHDPPLEILAPDGEVQQTLEALTREGKIRLAGISTKSPAQSLVAVEELGFRSVQVNFSLVDQRVIELGLLESCAAHGAALIARTPLCFGFLTGRYPASDGFAAGDHRALWKPEQIERWADAYRLFVDEPGLQGLSNTQIALRYVLSFDAVTTTIPGMLNEAHVEENASASPLGPLPPEIVARFGAIYRQHSFMA